MKMNAVTKSYDGATVLAVPELSFDAGKLYAVIGANGSGKSTLARLLGGVIAPDDKRAVLPAGVSVGYMPQRSFAFRMSVHANVRLAGGDDAKAAELMRELGLDALAGRRAALLSGGETARLALARLLMTDRDILILDEPTASMDIEATAMAEKLLRRVCRDRPCALIIITHSLPQARRLADEVLFLHRGRLLESGPVTRVLRTPVREETRQFLDFFGGM